MQDFSAGMVSERRIFCSWKRPIKTVVKGERFDLNHPFYILAATGHYSSQGVHGNIEMHNQYNLNINYFNIISPEITEINAHFLFVAYMCLAEELRFITSTLANLLSSIWWHAFTGPQC